MKTIIKQKLQRLDYIDISKALGMVLIMWGHIVEYGISHSFVYAFHIPLFFTLSGIVFQKERYPTLKVFLYKKWKSLLVPYIVFSLLTWAAWVGMEMVKGAPINSIWMPLAETIIAQGSGGFLIHNVPLWFVTCLFVVEFMYYYISRLPNYANITVCVIAMVIGVWMQDTNLFDFKLLPWNIEVALAALIFFSLGNVLLKNISSQDIVELVKNHRFIASVLLLLGFVIVYIIATNNGRVSMGSCRLNNPLLFYPGAIIGSFSMITLCILISLIKENPILKFIKWFGRNSFNAMAIHNPIKGLVVLATAAVMHVSKKDVQSFTLSAFVAFIILFISTIICLLLINKVITMLKKE